MMVNLLSYCQILVILVSVVALTAIAPVSNNFINMAYLRPFIEEKTCNDYIGIEWKYLASLYVWDKKFHWFGDRKQSDFVPFEAMIRDGWEELDHDVKPIYNIDLDRHYDFNRFFDGDEPRVILNKRLKMNIVYFYPLDRTKLLYIFSDDKSDDEKNDFYLIYNYKKLDSKSSPIQTISESSNDKGFIPLFHWRDGQQNDVFDIFTKIPVSFINNLDFTYRSGWFWILPVSFDFEHTYYYGFNQKLSKIYFARRRHYLGYVSDYLPASSIITSLPKWHPFRCYDYVYLVTETWVFVFPYLNLTEQLRKLDNPAIMEASVSLINTNALFHCGGGSLRVPTPTYPSKVISVYRQTVNDVESEDITERHQPDQSVTDLPRFLDMSKYDSLVEEETCAETIHWLDYGTIGSLFMWGTDLAMFYDDKEFSSSKKSFPLDWQYAVRKDYRTEPIYGIDIWMNADEQYKFWPRDHPLLLDKNGPYLGNEKVTFYYRWDATTILFIFRQSTDGTQDLFVPYNYIDYKERTIGILGNKTIRAGTIPLLHFGDEDPRYRYRIPQKSKCKSFRKNKLYATYINNVDFTYQSGYIGVDPVTFEFVKTYYYGFDKYLNRIYFAKKRQYLQSIPDYLNAESVVTVPRWHPFRCFDYIYLYTENWVFIFPFVDLESNLTEQHDFFVAHMTVMHRNTFFRCSRKPTNIDRPTYPSTELVILTPPDDDGDSNQQQQLFGLKSTYWYMAVIVLVVMVMAVLAVVIVKRRRKSSIHHSTLSKNSKTRTRSTPSKTSPSKQTPSRTGKLRSRKNRSTLGGGGGKTKSSTKSTPSSVRNSRSVLSRRSRTKSPKTPKTKRTSRMKSCNVGKTNTTSKLSKI